ncbi:hypothetical protein FW778_13365 [Ginsengibacter hankyongi]|uniref:Uncharacterized protein n=1 Tax=Ginsengibacter hankyongi TaxID=2607284 RepID=A0A5J5IF71_9BACT|nr:hypothetical protein [Ginsengibacter hankyongi]KAA9038543.1 hypothetical protein FW778_13365 [Ginsengibacter hankyongi]
MKILYLLTLILLFSCKSRPKTINKVSENSTIPQVPSPLVTQNLKHIKTGAELEINIQAEPLSDTSGPRVSVNNIPISFSSDGVISTAIFVKKVHGTPGEYFIPVTVTHVNHGKEIRIDKYIVSYFIDK